MAMTPTQRTLAEASRVDYNNRLAVQGYGEITTEIIDAGPFWLAPEEDHQQYLEKHPDGYCALRGTGVQASQPQPE